MEKQASFIFTALGGHVLQNIAGAKLVKSKGFLEGTAKALLSGTLARNARKGTLKEGLQSAATAVAAPEAIMATWHGRRPPQGSRTAPLSMVPWR